MSYSSEKSDNLFQHASAADLCIIDVRTAAEVRAKSLPGAIHIPLQDITADTVQQAVQAQHNSSGKVYFLCQSGRRAEIAAKQLDGKIARQLVVIEGGIQAVERSQPALILSQGNAISIERQVRIAAGSLVLTGVIAGVLLHAGWLALSGFVGAGLIFAGITDTCAMGLLLARMPWNK